MDGKSGLENEPKRGVQLSFFFLITSFFQQLILHLGLSLHVRL
jgi:hypothetical protein